MITSLSLENFKAWEDTETVDFGAITAFFGSNSSGKTSFLQSLLLLKQTADSADRGRVFDLGSTNSLVNLGTFNDVIYAHDDRRSLRMEIEWREEQPFRILSTEKKGQPVIAEDRDLSLAVCVASLRRGPIVDYVEYGLGDKTFTLQRTSKSDYTLEAENYKFLRVQGRAWPLPPPGKFYSFPDQIRAYYKNAAFLSDLELQFEKLCGKIFYLGPLRQDPERTYTWGGGRPSDVGKRGELAVQALISSQAEGKRDNARGFIRRRDGVWRSALITVEQHVAAWLQELGLISSFDVKPIDSRNTIYQVLVKRTPASPEVLLTDVGFGVSQVLPVLVLLAYIPEGSIVLLEQPEIHLHPAVQAGLADIIIEAAKVRRLQIVLESHSEHLLLRLQRRLAEKEMERNYSLEPDDCRLYFCQATGTGSTIERLDLDEFGNIKNWPDDFFGNSFGEVAAMNKAARKRAVRERNA
ncbi:DUF3696 domain-containing protein [Lentzea kentuckyensis]|uniref:DUF3696 domain-containing protein n=1 Tax=Lentzea kentuckyensis TaxID=360086 RepID=UPI000A3CD487|nr:DUF3696 domain-containing protein [Lentzea kentuckyensis]